VTEKALERHLLYRQTVRIEAQWPVDMGAGVVRCEEHPPGAGPALRTECDELEQVIRKTLDGIAFLTSPRDVVAQADTKGVIYERASYRFCRRVGF
jgi:hypothetical protein